MADNTWIVVTCIASSIFRDHKEDVGIFDTLFFKDIIDQQGICCLAEIMPEFRCTQDNYLIVIRAMLSSFGKSYEESERAE